MFSIFATHASDGERELEWLICGGDQGGGRELESRAEDWAGSAGQEAESRVVHLVGIIGQEAKNVRSGSGRGRVSLGQGTGLMSGTPGKKVGPHWTGAFPDASSGVQMKVKEMEQFMQIIKCWAYMNYFSLAFHAAVLETTTFSID